jgi:hypothetical protein
VVEFTDGRRTVELPIRAALPVLTRARSRDDLHPSVGLLAGAALLGMRFVAAGKFAPSTTTPATIRTRRSSLSDEAGSGAVGSVGLVWRSLVTWTTLGRPTDNPHITYAGRGRGLRHARDEG